MGAAYRSSTFGPQHPPDDAESSYEPRPAAQRPAGFTYFTTVIGPLLITPLQRRIRNCLGSLIFRPFVRRQDDALDYRFSELTNFQSSLGVAPLTSSRPGATSFSKTMMRPQILFDPRVILGLMMLWLILTTVYGD
jgi:hypothetical protein